MLANNNLNMKNMISEKLIMAGMITILFACNSPKEESAAVAAAPVVDKEQIKKDIQAKEDEFAATYNKGVLTDIGYYADDATNFYQNRPPVVGKKAIVDFLQSDLMSNSNKIEFKTNEVFVSSDANQVVEVGSFKVIDSTNATLNSGNYMTLFEKRNGKYVSVREMSASDMPAQ